jgi:DHA1 family tetracycline resistance protein-like MFS transporter
MPVCALAFSQSMYLHAALLASSGLFSATFALTFAYIADCVEKAQRAPAYGLALATFGLSFTLGPLAGSYIANSPLGERAVFWACVLLVVVNIAYIILFLPETIQPAPAPALAPAPSAAVTGESSSSSSSSSGITWGARIRQVLDYLPHSWDVQATFRVFHSNPFMTNLAVVVFIYYSAMWAIVSTLTVFVTRQLQFDSITLSWLLCGYGVVTMFSEGVLVRVIVPRIGEMNAIRLGLLAFSVQCAVVAFSTTPGMVFVSMMFSMLSNLVYPSVSSLVSKVVEEDGVGEALGALNGIKALTEGFGPLLFGLIMSLYSHHPMPGAPYLFAGVMTMWAFLHCYEMPEQPELVVAKHYAREHGREEGVGLLSEQGLDQERDSEYGHGHGHGVDRRSRGRGQGRGRGQDI